VKPQRLVPMSESLLSLALEMRRTRRQGLAAVKQRQRARLAEMVAFARTHSPYYRHLYRDLPARVDDAALLPVTSKPALMARFGDWVTDPAVTSGTVCAFLENPDLVGEPFLGRYLVGTTSGTSGHRGILLTDDRAWTIYTALAGRRARALLKAGDMLRVIRGGMRMAMLYVTGGHFVAIAGVMRELRRRRVLARRVRIFPVHTPMSELVPQVNRFRPAIVAGYAGTIAQLAGEQEAARLHIHPVQVHVTAEGLTGGEYDRIARAFGARVHNWYGCAEFAELTHACEQRRLHVNDDWAVFEPVDAGYRPTPPGERSHTVLLTNLANRVQPILRYDLGDSVLQYPDPCPCGSPLPAIHVQGRASESLAFPAADGARTTIAALVFRSVGDRTPGVDVLQIVQTAPANLRVRLRPAAGADADRLWCAVRETMSGLLVRHGLHHVTVERAGEPPEQTPGGKYRTVIPLSDDPGVERASKIF
jgi:phenylacetate-CoA ligase